MEEWKTGPPGKLRGDTERGFDDNSENRYKSGRRDDGMSELDKSVTRAEGEEEDGITKYQYYPVITSSAVPKGFLFSLRLFGG